MKFNVNQKTYRTAEFVPAEVLTAYGLDTRASIKDLVKASVPHDNINPGYLSGKELQKGAEDLFTKLTNEPTTVDIAGFRYSRRVASDVVSSILRSNPNFRPTVEDMIAEAVKPEHNQDGNSYLNRRELESAAYKIQQTIAAGNWS